MSRSHARFRHDECHLPSCQRHAARKKDSAHKTQNKQLIRWSILEIRRVTMRIARRASHLHTSSPGPSGDKRIKPLHDEQTSNQGRNCNVSIG
jgi:hypothetical protein